MEQKIYFKNLNGLRFISALLVIIHHTEKNKSRFNIDNIYLSVPAIGLIGKLGVVLFFVLSGYLITYLLLVEKQKTNTIDVKKFYIRRILRIWPLYYLIIILSLFILPYLSFFTLPQFPREIILDNLPSKTLLFALILPNLVLSQFGIVPYSSHTWSIGTEEQFYIFWPFIVRKIKKFRALMMIVVILSYISIRLLLSFSFCEIIPFHQFFKAYLATFHIDCMAIGGFYAIILYERKKILYLLLNNYTFYITLIIVLTLITLGFKIPYIVFHYEFYAIFFGVIILNFSANPNIGISLEHKIFNYLGNISYGLYMFHPLGIIFGIKTTLLLSDTNSNTLIYLFTLAFTIVIATLSYKYFESFFVRYKSKYTVIESGYSKTT